MHLTLVPWQTGQNIKNYLIIWTSSLTIQLTSSNAHIPSTSMGHASAFSSQYPITLALFLRFEDTLPRTRSWQSTITNLLYLTNSYCKSGTHKMLLLHNLSICNLHARLHLNHKNFQFNSTCTSIWAHSRNNTQYLSPSKPKSERKKNWIRLYYQTIFKLFTKSDF